MQLPELQTRADIPLLLNDLQLTGIGAELGVCRGFYSKVLLETSQLTTLYSIDRWAGDRGHTNEQREEAAARLRPYGSRSVLVTATFEEAVVQFPDEHFDFVYIDGYAHTGQDDGQTMDLWWPKVKPGGIMAGHDYGEGAFQVNKDAVDRFVASTGLPMYLTHEKEEHIPDDVQIPSWLIQKPQRSAS
jgi:hypothetical protein